MNEPNPLLRSVMAPYRGGKLLVPGNVVAEVIDYAKPTPQEQGPAWLLGELEWNSWQVPIISYALLSDSTSRDPVGTGSRILILKTLTQESSLYYIGILINGVPKLKKLGPDGIDHIDEDPGSSTIFCHAELDGDEVVIPALDELTKVVASAVYDQ
jgi:chemosensory pili system protein ChpC